MYYGFLQGGAFGTSLYKNELRLHKANQFGDLMQFVVVVINCTSSFNLSTKTPHLEREKVFGLAKCKSNLPLGSKADSHQHDHYPPKSNTQCLVLQKDTKHYCKTKIIQNIHIMVFLLCVMLVIGLQPKVHRSNYINFGFVMMSLIIVWEGQTTNMHLIGQPCLHYGLCKKGQISFKLKW